MPVITINGKKIEIEQGKTVLEVARSQGIPIPTLCYHHGLEPYGACRLCLVEVVSGGRPGLSASCALPAADGLVVDTDTPRVLRIRKIIMRLFLARCPESAKIKELTRELDAKSLPHKAETSDCALCGLCVRACSAMGKRVIDFSYRGIHRRVGTPFTKPSPDCIGCRACESVCPLGRIKVYEENGQVKIIPWDTKQAVIHCISCGSPFGTYSHVLDLENRIECNDNKYLCPACRRRKIAGYTGFLK